MHNKLDPRDPRFIEFYLSGGDVPKEVNDKNPSTSLSSEESEVLLNQGFYKPVATKEGVGFKNN
jgi:hypothetical protein